MLRRREVGLAVGLLLLAAPCRAEMASDLPRHPEAVTLKGVPLTVLGPVLQVGDRAPDAAVMNQEMQPVRLSDWNGKLRVLSTVPSLETATCSMHAWSLNELQSEFGPEVVLLTVSMDLPHAQRRWCGTHGVKDMVMLSDFRDREVGRGYGVLIEETGLLARAVFVIDREGVIRYIQRVSELSREPDYEAVVEAVRRITGGL